jgi:hypothetical protein
MCIGLHLVACLLENAAKRWLSTTMLSRVSTSGRTGRTMSKPGSISQRARQGEEKVSN